MALMGGLGSTNKQGRTSYLVRQINKVSHILLFPRVPCSSLMLLMDLAKTDPPLIGRDLVTHSD